jgi:hypothetical protein
LSVLCFSEAFIFRNDRPEILHRVFDFVGTKADVALEESRLFTSNPAQGNTIGFTRPLREVFLRHKDIARKYAPAHDSWMYLIAVASGTSRMLFNVPTTLYRVHGSNWIGDSLQWRGITYLSRKWRLQQAIRRWLSRQAEGFCLASATLTPGPKLERLVMLAQLVATLDRRQSPAFLVRLARHRAMPPSRRFAVWLAAACLCCDATT